MSEYRLEDMVQALQEKLGDKLVSSQDRFFTFLQVNPGEILGLSKILRDEYGFNHLANLTAVDYEDTFEMVYHLYSIPDNNKIVLKTRIPRNKPEIESVFSVWSSADWQEREAYDLMGIVFKNHPNLIRILMPNDFEGHPLRKDFKMEGR